MTRIARAVVSRWKRLSIARSPYYRRYPPSIDVRHLCHRNIVSLEHQYVYFRIPKAANSTIVSSLAAANSGVRRDYSFQEMQQLKTTGVLHLHELSARQVLSLAEEFYKFTFVRNPIDRAVSCYRDKIQKAPKTAHAGLVRKRLGLSSNSEISFSVFLEYLESGGLTENAHWAPQSSLLSMPIQPLDYIGRVETLESDFSLISDRIFGIAHQLTNWMPHATKCSGATSLGERELDRLRKLYRCDFENLGYSFEY